MEQKRPERIGRNKTDYEESRGGENGSTGGGHDDSSLLVDVREAAAMCRMSRAMLYKLHRNGGTPRSVRLGKLIRWRRREFLDWIAAGCPDRAAWEASRDG